MANADTTTTRAISRARHTAGLALEVADAAEGDRMLLRAARLLIEYAVSALQMTLDAPGGALDVDDDNGHDEDEESGHE